MAKHVILALVALAVTGACVSALDNGLQRVPTMGWMSWERFGCEIDCKNNPDNCISAALYKAQADRMVEDGWLEAGYEYVNVDDCWLAKNRNATGDLQADEERFPGGIRALCDYLHAKGLKCGLYEDIGTKTCAGYPGLDVQPGSGKPEQLARDAAVMASFGIDYLKVDGCNQSPSVMNETYPRLSKALNQTGRPIVLSCSWPAYMSNRMTDETYKLLVQYCNGWRNWDDINDSWASVSSIIGWWTKWQKNLTAVAQPGALNDPDQLLGGNTGLSISETEVQFGMWALFAAPLFMSNDLRAIAPEIRAILQNREAIAINQDPLVVQASMVRGDVSQQSVFVKPLKNGDRAVGLLNMHAGVPGFPVAIEFSAKDAGLPDGTVFSAHDVFGRRGLGTFHGSFSHKVPCSSMLLLRITPH